MPQSDMKTDAGNTSVTSIAPKALWKNSRAGFAAFWFGSLMVVWLALRLVLLFRFGPPGQIGVLFLTFLCGLSRDVLAATWLTLPVIGWLVLAPECRFRSLGHRLFFWLACLIFWFGQTFLWFIEY